MTSVLRPGSKVLARAAVEPQATSMRVAMAPPWRLPVWLNAASDTGISTTTPSSVGEEPQVEQLVQRRLEERRPQVLGDRGCVELLAPGHHMAPALDGGIPAAAPSGSLVRTITGRYQARRRQAETV